MRLGRWWALVLLVAMLVTLSACGFDRFDAKGWAGLAVSDDALYVTSGDGRVFALNVSEDAEGSAGRPALLYNPFPSPNEDGLGAVYSTPVLGAYAGEDGPGAETIFLTTYQDPEEDDDLRRQRLRVERRHRRPELVDHPARPHRGHARAGRQLARRRH